MTKNPLKQLAELGQSPWYDFITRDLVRSGELQRLIDQDGLRGMTSNPTIFEKSVAGTDRYDADIRRLGAQGRSPAQIFEALAVADVQAACDVFRPVYDAANGGDGLVSLEVSPNLANDTMATIAEAQRLWQTVNRPNAMIKIPGTLEGLPAITGCLAAGVNVNVTLLFSVERYREVIEAFFAGLDERLGRGLPVDRTQSVASFFVSRLDSKVDPVLERLASAGATGLPARGSTAVANACQAYAIFRGAFAGARWERLAARGARVQRPLWASTSTKDPRLSDIHYVEALIAPQTVNTLPPATFAAYRDHGRPEVRIQEGIVAAPQIMTGLKRAGIDLAVVTRALEVEGVASFAASYTSLLASIEAKQGALAGTG